MPASDPMTEALARLRAEMVEAETVLDQMNADGAPLDEAFAQAASYAARRRTYLDAARGGNAAQVVRSAIEHGSGGDALGDLLAAIPDSTPDADEKPAPKPDEDPLAALFA